MNEKIQNILTEIESVIVGKNENVEKILMAILAPVSYTHLGHPQRDRTRTVRQAMRPPPR